MKSMKSDCSNLLSVLNTKKILYAEDELDVAKETIGILELFFDKVVYVTNGQEALDEFEYSNYDVLMLDICMPEMDGLEVIKHIRTKNHKIPIIVLSAFTEQKYLWRAVELKIAKYLAKPYTTDSFMEALREVSLELMDYKIDIEIAPAFFYDHCTKELSHCGGTVRLSKNESKILEYLINRKNQIVTFDEFYDYIWEYKSCSKEAVKSTIRDLRKKVGKKVIKNIYGVGYTLEI